MAMEVIPTSVLEWIVWLGSKSLGEEMEGESPKWSHPFQTWTDWYQGNISVRFVLFYF